MLNSLLTLLVRFLVWLRYRVTVRGLDAVAAKGSRGILFLPNHPALVDPIILLSRLYGSFRARALADSRQIDRFFIRWLAKRIRVLPIPDLAKSGAASSDQVRQVLQACIAALKQGDNLVLYPAGRTYRTRYEDLAGNSAVETILRELPGLCVVLVRTHGLWGSRFSRAHGGEPKVAREVRRGALSLLASGIFFAPRREVSIELFEPADLPRGADRAVLNRYLEAYYNREAPPSLYVPYTIWERGGLRPLPEPEPPKLRGDPAGVPAATRQIVAAHLEKLAGVSEFDDHARLAYDLGLDSLSMVELLTWLEAEFGFPQEHFDALRTVGDVMLAACGEAVSSEAAKIAPPPARWHSCGRISVPDRLADLTIPQAFLAQASRRAGRAAVADQTSGVRTYRDLIAAVLALRPVVGELPGECVGLMMPASVAADVLYLSILFAGKTPVMANWTLGRQNLLHCLESVGAQRVLTARALVTRLEAHGVDLSGLRDRFVFVEDVAARLGLWSRLRVGLQARFSWAALSRVVPSPTAVILFTSGSENLPKAVPLSHRNILSNVSDLVGSVVLKDDDRLLAILPPFHSFGLTTSVVLPLCVGLRVAYSPDPTAGRALAQMVDAYKATLLFGTPTFLKGILRASEEGSLSALRLVVTGAEKCPPHVYDQLAQRCPRAIVLEGYGVTECSPVISMNREVDARHGTIGRLLPSLRHAIVEPDTHRRVPPGRPGLLLVTGPSVFEGYLEHGRPSPFVEFEGERWYSTGDLVCEDADGLLSFGGRLKRFIKLGGEMVSLPAIESVLTEAFGSAADEGPVLAVVATPDDERPEIVLFATKEITRDEANRAIRSAGLSGLHNIRQVIRLDELPLLGTGKTDYRALRSMLNQLSQ